MRSCSTLPTTRIPGRPSSSERSGPSPTNVSDPSPSRSNARARRSDVLALAERADAEEGGSLSGVAREGLEALEVDAAVDHLGLAPRLGHALLEQPPQVVRDGDHRACAADDQPRRRPDARNPADVRDVLAVSGDDERCASEESAPEARRNEEVRVDDVGPEPPRGARCRSPRAAGGGAARRSACRAPPARPRARTRRARAPGPPRRRRGRARPRSGTSGRRAGSARAPA